ncbi:hypothetical protein CaCOL14_008255 [Colletotrichum acutatum]
MSSNLLNFNKPCNGCRRRKVRCDKAKPCLNCVRHGISCVYDPQREPGIPSPESQQQLQERVDRLERVIEEMKGMSVRGESLKATSSSFPSASPATSHFGEFYHERDESLAGDPGMQVYDENVSYYLGPDYWLNLQDVVYEPRCLFRIDSDKTGKNPASPSSWPIGRTPVLTDLSHLHLEPEKEDILTDLFLAHVEPYVRIVHESYWRQQITDFRVGVHKIPIDVEAGMFATQAMTVAALPANLIQERLGKPKKDLLRHLQEATQLALERADILRSRKVLAFFALLYHIQAKFITGDGEIAVSLLGLAGRFGTRLGLHRDPSHYSYSPWIANMRRRVWTHFEIMDNPVYNLEGADSGLPSISDVQPAKNANDIETVVARHTGAGQDAEFRSGFYQECVEILEEAERGEAVALQNHCGWIYRWPTTPFTISNILIGLAQQPKHPVTDRAWRQMNIVFRRHNNEDISMRKFAAWRVIEALCDQAMLYHKQRSHEGAWYAQRLDQVQALTTAQGKASLSLENATVDDILGDVQMFGQDASVLGGHSYFAAQQALEPLGYPPWNQSPTEQSHGQSQPHPHQHPHPHQPPSDDGEDI